MIKGVHVTFYTPEADALRSFFTDTLKFPSVDAGRGWLIFALPPADLGVHPIQRGDERKGEMGHEMSFYCDDIHQTISELEARGVRFTSEVVDEGWGLSTTFAITGGGDVQLYQPRYAKPVWVEQSANKKTAAKKTAAKKAVSKTSAGKKKATKGRRR
jgi:catechol 2,3-dioxygenase-like lactoylglutathione lyase family enzyme